MKAFIVELPNRPGSLATVAEALGAQGVNITGSAGATSGSSGSLSITVENEDAARRILEANGWGYREVDLVVAAVDHRPGTLGAAARRLADAGINIEAMFVTGMDGGKVHIGFGVGDASAAKTALGDLCVS